MVGLPLVLTQPIRWRNSQPDFTLELPDENLHQLSAQRGPSPSDVFDVGTASRTTLRLLEGIKQRAEGAAETDHVSVNSWLVRAIAAALDSTSTRSAGMSVAPSNGQNFSDWVH